MWGLRCPYCGGAQGRCAATQSGRSVTECSSCGRVVEERQSEPHDLFLLRAQDSPLCLVTPDLSLPPVECLGDDPFEPTGFITAFSTWSLEPTPLFARSSFSFSGHLAELERALDSSSSSSSSNSSSTSGPLVVVDNLRAYLQILDVSSILGLDRDISDQAFQLFRDCCSATCLRNRSVEALATAALVQAIREAQEPRTLQEISIAANLPQKEIGKYIKILGEALNLSQPINSNSISVHMPRFCTLLQLNKSAQELATHIGEVVINKCFCTRRNPISISAAAIYLACQLEDKRKTQAEICKITGLTEVTLRKVYKELLENWDDLRPPNYTPVIPPEKAFPTTAITSGRSSTPRVDPIEVTTSSVQQDKDKQSNAIKPNTNALEVSETDRVARGKEEVDTISNSSSYGGVNIDPRVLNQAGFWKQQQETRILFGMPDFSAGERNQTKNQGMLDINEKPSSTSEVEEKMDGDPETSSTQRAAQFSSEEAKKSNPWPFRTPLVLGPPYYRFAQPPHAMCSGSAGPQGVGGQKSDSEKRDQ